MCPGHHFNIKVAYICVHCSNYECIKCGNHHFNAKPAYICIHCNDYNCVK